MIKEQSPLAGKTLKVVDGQFKGQDFTVEDYACNVWDTVDWDFKWNNPAVLEYLTTHQGNHLPDDTQTALYGKIGPFGHVLQRRELEEE